MFLLLGRQATDLTQAEIPRHGQMIRRVRVCDSRRVGTAASPSDELQIHNPDCALTRGGIVKEHQRPRL